MKPMLRRIDIFAMIVLVCALCGSAYGQRGGLPYGPTDAEMAVLPQYCYARMRDDPNAKRLWEQRMGRDQFVHVHHHCMALNFMSRASAEFDPKRRKVHLQRAVSNFNYVLKRWPESFPLTAEARNYRIQAESQLQLY